MSFPRLRPLGEAAFTVELGDAIDPLLASRVRGLDAALAESRPQWLREAVPTYRSLLLVVDPAARAEAETCALALAAGAAPQARPGRVLQVPVVYGGEHGPDLEEVARHCALAPAEVIARHSAVEYTALMLGFLPGFAYLGLLPPELRTPRRATPRIRVPAGSVALAALQTAVYPFASPGGWNLIGRTSLRFFDPEAATPALLQPGDRVRFHAVDELPLAEGAAPRPAAASAPAVEVVTPGLLTTVQDGGRRGWRRVGVPWSGAMDVPAAAAANGAVGNAEGAAVLECTLQGPTLRFLRALRFALAGADLEAVLERADLGAWPVPPNRPVLARPGNVLRFGQRRRGCRAYLAFAGGLDVPLVLGSRATDLAAGFGGHQGRALRAGDRLAVLPDAGLRPRERAADLPHGGTVELRVVAGPQDDAFPTAAWQRFITSEWVVSAESDRAGFRLSGPALSHSGSGEVVTDGMVPGSVQVPPDGQPIVMGAEGPTSGGYPKIATVIGADLPRLAQVAPGEPVRFRAVTLDEALRWAR